MRQVIALPRRGGKTEKMIEWLLAAAIEAPDEHRIIVSHSLAESHRVQRLMIERALPLESWQFVAAGEIYYEHRGLWSGVRLRDEQEKAHREFVLGVDNADLVLEYFLHHRVGIASVTTE
jgi:hypothetical protein